MSDAPIQVSTTSLLLDGLRDEDNRVVWEEFDRRYRPILYGFALRLRLEPADAADVAQETLLRFVQEYRAGKYDRGQGRLRAWLIGIARYRIADVRRDQARKRIARGESAMGELVGEDEAERLWDLEQRRFIFHSALAELRGSSRLNERTIEAFERVVLRRQPVREVAAELGVTPQEIYDAKSRVVEKLRESLQKYKSLLADE